MFSFLLAITYLAFISLGLPDSLLGSGWPAMQAQMNVPVSYAGIISMIIAIGTVISSLLSDRITRKLGTGLVTAVSVLLTAGALFGFSVSGSFWILCLLAVPYGLGAGAVDAALNNYVALHYVSRHMNWLHCFWGVGAAISPFIMSFCLTNGMGWNIGYRTVSIIQIVLTVLLFISLPLWKKREVQEDKTAPALSIRKIVGIKGVKYVLASFLAYCGLESTAGLWASSYLAIARGMNAETAASCASLFYLGITLGRFLSGFVSNKLGDRMMVRIGVGVMFLGVVFILIPVKADFLCLTGLVAAGLGCAPVYPSLIHATPANFGADKSQAIIGVQMASAYTGSTFAPPLFGLLSGLAGIGLYPFYLLAFTVLILLMTEGLNKACPH